MHNIIQEIIFINQVDIIKAICCKFMDFYDSSEFWAMCSLICLIKERREYACVDV